MQVELFYLFQLYGAIYNLIRHEVPKFGIESTFVSVEDPESLRKALTPKTALVMRHLNKRSCLH
jgi:O-acetylhomoserine/O-acetylserine sulfhydrylase-like pyridoxal-dependent enzyme